MLSVRSFECWKVTKTKWLLLFEFCYGLSVGTCIDGRLNSFVIFWHPASFGVATSSVSGSFLRLGQSNFSARCSTFNYQLQIERGYPLNLSILISGGKENNCDSLSNGEWSGKRPSTKPPVCELRSNVSYAGVRLWINCRLDRHRVVVPERVVGP